MKARASILLIGLLLLAAAPTMASEKVSDVYDQDTGVGQALIHVEGPYYLYIFYVDLDGSGDYTPADQIIRIVRAILLP
jgi:hypothetical protein